jgi:hypothetical protein
LEDHLRLLPYLLFLSRVLRLYLGLCRLLQALAAALAEILAAAVLLALVEVQFVALLVLLLARLAVVVLALLALQLPARPHLRLLLALRFLGFVLALALPGQLVAHWQSHSRCC